MKLTKEQFDQYNKSPGFGQNQSDEFIRKLANIPDNKYYTVSRYPIEGIVTIGRDRDVPKSKISKSDQK